MMSNISGVRSLAGGGWMALQPPYEEKYRGVGC